MPTDTISAAAFAIEHVLCRIHESPEVGYYMGYGTESFERLCVAYSEITGELATATEERFAPKNPRNPCRDLERQVEDLQRRLSGSHSCSEDAPTFGPENLTAYGMVERVKDLLGLHSSDSVRCTREISALFHAQELPINLVLTSAP